MPINKIPIVEAMQEEFLPYSAEILINNLPSIDGLLPVHRKVLWSMYNKKRTHDRPHTKTIKVMGEIVTYYTFGDGPLYSTMVNMANNGMNHSLLDGKGSWGDKFRSDGYPASQRYTECRTTKYGEYMLHNVNKGNVPMKPNFDNTEFEPIVLPSILPNILLNTSQSIAVSEASKIPAHNINEVVDAIKHYITTSDIDSTIDILKCPDLSSGGKIIYDKNTFHKIYKTGKGSFTIVGKFNYVEKTRVVQIREIPYETTINAIENKIIAEYDKGTFKEVSDIRNATGKDGIRLDITLKKGSDVDMFIKKLRRYTPFETKMSFNCTLLDLDWKTPKLMSLEEILSKWVIFRTDTIKAELQHDIDKAAKDLDRLYGLQKLLSDLDTAIKLIRSSKSQKEAMDKLIRHFELNDEQAEYVATIRLVNMNEEWIHNRTAHIEELEESIKKFTRTMNSESRIHKIISKQLDEMKKHFGKERRTEIVLASEDQHAAADVVKEIPEYKVKIFITKDGYLKKVPLTSIKSNLEHKLKEEDEIVEEYDASNTTELLFFTNNGEVYKKFAYDISDHKLSSFGDYIPTIIGVSQGEEVIRVCKIEEDNYIYMAYDTGKMNKVASEAYKTKTNRTKLTTGYNKKQKLINLFQGPSSMNIVCESDFKKILVIDTENINAKATPGAMGVQVMKPKKARKQKNPKPDSKTILCEPVDNYNRQLHDINYYMAKPNSIGKYFKVVENNEDQTELLNEE